MELKHIDIENLKPAKVNVRKVGGRDIADLVPSIKSLGLLQPLLVRPNCDGFEIVAGQRRYHALAKLAEEHGAHDPVPCIVMEDGDDAKAIEASLTENIARLPMDEIDQHKAFAALMKQGQSVEDIAARFGVTERLVKQRLAIANIYGPILTAYRKREIPGETLRTLTLATTKQQKKWWEMFKSDDVRAPEGRALRDWLFGGGHIPTANALFDLADYKGATVSDLFGEDSYFDDAATFWELQNKAIAKLKEAYIAAGWAEVVILDRGAYWPSWEYVGTSRQDGGKVFIQIGHDGEVTCREGFITEKQAKRREKAANGKGTQPAAKPELTKAMQSYLDLHRHSAVRTELLNHAGMALRLAVAQIIAGSYLWSVHAEPQKANTEAIGDSLKANKAEEVFATERQAVRELLDLPGEDDGEDAGTDATLVPLKSDWYPAPDIHAIFAKLIALDDATVTRILTFVTAETLGSGDGMVEVLGQSPESRYGRHIGNRTTHSSTYCETNPPLTPSFSGTSCGTKRTADAHISSTAKVQKQIVRDYLNGTRQIEGEGR